MLDFADEKGQLCTRLLAELGAEVVKVEPRERATRRARTGLLQRRIRTEQEHLLVGDERWKALHLHLNSSSKPAVTCCES
ncbi:MAG: CoA transferase [Dehalococcoidia bacterium]